MILKLILMNLPILFLPFIQIIPGGEKAMQEAPLTGYLISAIVALGATVTYLFIRLEKINNREQNVYKDQIRDYKEITSKNTEAFMMNTHATEELIESNKETKEAVVNLRLWLVENLESNKKRPRS